MFFYKERYYFLKPTMYSENNDMEFEVYSDDGRFLGSNIYGLRNPYIKTDEQLEFGDIVDIECQKAELKIRFSKEYNTYIENITSLSLDIDAIIETLVRKYNMSYEFVCDYI